MKLYAIEIKHIELVLTSESLKKRLMFENYQQKYKHCKQKKQPIHFDTIF